ncbi:hypothetical protein EMO91_02090 [Bifidobacterium myosotis]|uniref:Uncharacterized protein n=1 Tax=Bifidobacterium myosotis TaxID=1630166 RepID=A0A5M9ZQQ2_9BIFI|nr:hypothetical protein EMO91_02090 [Bifidobacterium myosotis]
MYSRVHEPAVRDGLFTSGTFGAHGRRLPAYPHNPLAVVAVGWRYAKRPSTILGARAEVFNYRRRPRRSIRER